jgi:hypothetical protein
MDSCKNPINCFKYLTEISRRRLSAKFVGNLLILSIFIRNKANFHMQINELSHAAHKKSMDFVEI